MSQIVLGVVSALVSILAGALAGAAIEALRKRSKRNQLPLTSYSEKMAALTKNLLGATAEVDRVLNEISTVSRNKETSIAELETKLVELARREKRQQENIQALERVPLPAAKYFAESIEREQRRSAWRDYILFGLGVVVSTVITIALKVLIGA